jgi:hypothetical protein
MTSRSHDRPMIKGGTVARAKHTDRAEARRRYRQAVTPSEDGGADIDEGQVPVTGAQARANRGDQKAAPAPSGRPGFLSAFRGAYYPPRLREDLGHLRQIITSRGLLAAIGLVAAGAVAFTVLPGYTGSTFAWELLVLPGQALAPQLVAGFFAPRASYILGFIVGLVQGLVFAIVFPMISARLGAPLPADQIPNLLTLSFITGPISGTLFAAAAAWYRRFLALSSPRRTAPPGRGRTPAKGNPSRRAAGR